MSFETQGLSSINRVSYEDWLFVKRLTVSMVKTLDERLAKLRMLIMKVREEYGLSEADLSNEDDERVKLLKSLLGEVVDLDEYIDRLR